VGDYVIALGASEAQRFRSWIAHRLGLHFDDAKHRNACGSKRRLHLVGSASE
jgi:hypothetical protein